MNTIEGLKEDDLTSVVIRSHRDYLDVLNKICRDTEKIVLVQIDGPDEDDPVLAAAKQMMTLESESIVDEWIGTISPGRGAAEFVFRKSREFFGYLSGYESFFIVEGEHKYTVRETGFGYDDIAFIGAGGEILLYTITHEGYAAINEKYI